MLILVILVIDLVGEELPCIAVPRGTIDARSYKSPALNGETNGAGPGRSFIRGLFRPEIGGEIIFPGIRIYGTIATKRDISLVPGIRPRDNERNGVIADDIIVTIVIGAGVGIGDIPQALPLIGAHTRIEPPEIIGGAADSPLG